MARALRRLGFHKNGTPRAWLRSVLCDAKGKVRPAFRRVVFKKNGTPRPQYANWFTEGDFTDRINGPMHVQQFLSTRWKDLRPLTTFPETAQVNRVTLVTDSIGSDSLFGGVGTALILAALWAKRTGADLRIATRTGRPVNSAFAALLAANQITFDGRVDFIHAPQFGGAEVPVGDGDMFLATSWWSARCLLNTVPASRIIYLLQEDERMFYPYGDDHLACSATLAEPFRLVIVNSGLLHRHLTDGPDAVPGLAGRSAWFEPAFRVPSRKPGEKTGKQKLFFYARPNNPRNLYATGLKVINDAVLHGILDPKRWSVHLVGRGIEPLTFDGGLETVLHEPMPWKDYAEFLLGMDAGLSLMYTPHPSYPPLDLAAMGIPVLTNSFGIKTDLTFYSGNILCAEPTVSAMLDGFRRLMVLAGDPAACAENLARDHINRDWPTALSDVVETLAALSARSA